MRKKFILNVLLVLAAKGEITISPKQSKIGSRPAGSNLVLTCEGGQDLEWIGPNGLTITAKDRKQSPTYVQKIRNSVSVLQNVKQIIF